MIVGPFLWLRDFLETEDNPNVPFLGDAVRDCIPPQYLEMFTAVVDQIKSKIGVVVLRQICQKSSPDVLDPQTLSSPVVPFTIRPTSEDDIVPEDQRWKYAYRRLLMNVDPIYLPIRWIELGMTEEGERVQRKICSLNFPPSRFALIHQSSDFKKVLLVMKKSLYVKYVDLFVELYRHHFVDFDKVLTVGGKPWPIEEIVAYFETECGGDVTAFIRNMRSWEEAA